ALHAAAEGGERFLVGIVLDTRALEVDRLAIEVGELALGDGAAHRARDGQGLHFGSSFPASGAQRPCCCQSRTAVIDRPMTITATRALSRPSRRASRAPL